MEKLQDILKEKFDICYVLNLSDRKDRRNNMEAQFKEMNFDNINESTWLRYHYTTKFPYNSLIASAFNESGKGRFTKANEYDCARSHYSIVKECYDRGFKHILIMEDDIKFLKDSQTFCSYLSNIPNDYDILLYFTPSLDQYIYPICPEYGIDLPVDNVGVYRPYYMTDFPNKPEGKASNNWPQYSEVCYQFGFTTYGGNSEVT